MTQLLAPSLIGSAPPANAPPGLPTSAAKGGAGAGQDPTGAFASLLSEATSAVQGGETGPPPTGGTPSMLVDPSEAELVAGLAALMSQLLGANPEGDTPETPTDLSLLDRPAGAGETDMNDGSSALEALMAFLVVGQQNVEQPAAMPSLADVRDLLAAAQGAFDGTSITDATGTGEGAVTLPTEIPEAVLTAFASMADAAGLTTGDKAGTELATAALTALQAAAREAGGATAAPTGATEATVLTDAELAALAAEVSASESVTSTEVPTGEQEQTLSALVTPVGTETETDQPAFVAQVTSDLDPAQLKADDAATARNAAAAAATNAAPASVGVEAPVQARVVNATTLPADVADSVQTAVLRGDSEVRLVLNPPELGQVEVNIVTHEGGLRIRLEASHPGARDLMERSLPALQQALEARELRVERLTVQATDTGRGSLDTSAGGGQFHGERDANPGDSGPEWSGVASFAASAERMMVKPSQSQQADGRLDVMA